MSKAVVANVFIRFYVDELDCNLKSNECMEMKCTIKRLNNHYLKRPAFNELFLSPSYFFKISSCVEKLDYILTMEDRSV